MLYWFLNEIYRVINRVTNKLSALQFKDCKQLGKNLHVAAPVTTYGLSWISIGDNFRAGPRLKLRAFSDWRDSAYTPEIIIGDNVNIESDCHIGAINSIIIEDNVLIASFVYISDHSHGEINSEALTLPPLQRPLVSKGGIRICRNAWIGEKAIILPGVVIGEGAIVGAGAVVTKNVPPYAVAAGIPAKVIRQL